MFYANRFSGLGGVVTPTYIHRGLHTHIGNLVNAALSIRMTLNTKPACGRFWQPEHFLISDHWRVASWEGPM